MEGAVAARVNFNASTTAGGHISSRAGPGIDANIFPRVNAEIFNSPFFSVSDKTSTDVSNYVSDEIFADISPQVSDKTIADISLRADDEIFFRSRAQERQTSRSDHSGRRRASERFA
ncbi:MAG TPA: hypothetical protein VKG02_21005 [Blastocatellia bacterium]|nr:hypothetical protein [Blastocatellia bacterium]